MTHHTPSPTANAQDVTATHSNTLCVVELKPVGLDERCGFSAGLAHHAPKSPEWMAACEQLASQYDRWSLADRAAQIRAGHPAWLIEHACVEAILTLTLDAAQPYLVWSNEHRAWWGKDERGYTKIIANAGRYDRDTALTIAGTRGGGWRLNKGNPDEIAIPEADAVDQYAGITASQVQS